MTVNPTTGDDGATSNDPGRADLRPADNALQFYLAIIDELPVYVVSKDLKGKYTVVSRQYAEKLGATPAEVVGKTDFDFYSEEQARRYREEDQQVIRSEEMLVSTELDLTGEKPKHFALRKGPVHGVDGSVIGVQTIFWDITEQKAAEKALLDERDMLQTIMDQIPDFIYVKDTAGKYVVVNEGVRQVLGSDSVADVVGKSNFDFLPHDQAELGRLDDAEVIELGEPMIEREERLTDRDGNELWILTSKLPLRDREGNISGVVGIDRNITRIKNTEIQLRTAKAAADEANRAKGDFLANMSHEIRTPMNAIIGMTDLLLETQMTAAQREYLNMVQDSGESLMSLINDILDFSKIESGKFELEVTSFDIRETLGDTMKSLGLRAYKKGLELAVNVDREIPKFLKGDPVRLRQIIINLVGNAIKFTEQGEVVLGILSQSNTENEITLLASVTDTGVGIAQDQCEKIFEKFEQADASTTRRFGGTGLGLAISSRLVELMGGQIWVESEIGQGSKFQFTLTLEIDHEQKAPIVENLVEVQGVRVLIVDDNATNRRILEQMLINWGMVPVTASGANQAIQLLSDAQDSDPIKLVISDVNMPETDGLQLARDIGKREELKNTSIIMLTSGARPEVAAELRSIGIDFHLMKPVKQSELFRAMIATLDDQGGDSATTKIESRTTPAQQTRRLQILVAEDNVVNQKLAVGVLNGLGHEVTVVGNGVAAVNAVARNVDDGQETFDLILMDVQMPEMDGHEATREIRKLESPTGSHIPIIAMTAHAMKGDRELCLEAGMDDYLAKPVRLKDITKKLSELFPAAKDSASIALPNVTAKANAGPIVWEQAIKSAGGNHKLFYEVIVAFMEDTPRLLTTAEDAAELGDSVALCAAAHSIRGSLMFLHANDAFESAHRIELMSGQGNVAQASAELQAFKGKYTQIRGLLDAYIAENKPY